MPDYRTHSHMYYNEDLDEYRLSLWTLQASGDESMAIVASLNDVDLDLLEKQITRARGQKAAYLEDPIAAEKGE
jgi:hypothetical protein